MTTPIADVMPVSYTMRPNASNPNWAMRVTTGNASDVVRIPMPVGVATVIVTWNGPGYIGIYVGGHQVAQIAAGTAGVRRRIMFEAPTDVANQTMQLLGSGLTAADVEDRFTAGVTVIPVST